MGRPYRFRNLIRTFVLLVMLGGSVLSIVFFSFLRGFQLLPRAFFATIWMPMIIIIVANILTAVVYLFLFPKLIRPIEALSEATKKVAKGDFTIRVESEDMVGEVKDLVDSFNAMTKELGSTEIFRSDFIRDFSHEFKTPIVSLAGFAKELKNPDISEEERQMYCDIIINESERLSKMSANVLLLSKFENQQIVSDKTPFSLDEQIRRCILLQEKGWTEKNLELDLDLDPITVCQNEEMLHHLWTNLISNAIKFTPAGGKIIIRATQNEESVVVTVRDTGIGMTQKQMEHIFDKCYQADPSHSGSGNGLGLCIVKRICTLCGGNIRVRSQPDQGSVFTVFLPK